jgi:hypothetical protein
MQPYQNFTVDVVADSISLAGKRITTFQLKYPRFIHSELMTHRVFSRNASSSRAIPVKTMIKQVWNQPAMPIVWGANQAGMQATRLLSDRKEWLAKFIWLTTSKFAVAFAWSLSKIGLHKQVTNRILEPFQHINVVLTSTEWDNFFELRCHHAAQPEIRHLANLMRQAMQDSEPTLLKGGEWHLPYISTLERLNHTLEDLLKMSAAHCARASYNKHSGGKSTLEEDTELFNQLVTRPYTDKRGTVYDESSPIHASPIEHQATPMLEAHLSSGNFKGWAQYRQLFVQDLIDKAEKEKIAELHKK